MYKTLIAALGCVVILASCGQKKDTESASVQDSTAVADNTKVAEKIDTVPAPASATNNTIMGIMEKNMQDMMTLRPTGNVDVDFAATMKLHHMSAIEASQLVLSNGVDSTIRRMANKMLQDQQKEVSDFDAFIARQKPEGGDSAFFNQSMAAMHKMNMSMDHSGSIDKQFVVMMIPHHQGAIDMSQLYLKSGKNTEMKRIASNIISAQRKEINELKAWLAKNK